MPPSSHSDRPNHSVTARAENDRAIIESREEYSGPLPHPRLLQEWEKVVPGSAERIIAKFESQTEHRMRIEYLVVRTDSIKSLGGLAAGFLIAMTAIVGGIYTALQGQPFLGGTLSFAGLAMLVGAFVANRFWKDK